MHHPTTTTTTRHTFNRRYAFMTHERGKDRGAGAPARLLSSSARRMNTHMLTPHSWTCICTRTRAHTHTHTRTTSACTIQGLSLLALSPSAMCIEQACGSLETHRSRSRGGCGRACAGGVVTTRKPGTHLQTNRLYLRGGASARVYSHGVHGHMDDGDRMAKC